MIAGAYVDEPNIGISTISQAVCSFAFMVFDLRRMHMTSG